MNPNTSLSDQFNGAGVETTPLVDVMPELLIPLYFYRCHSAWKSNELSYILQEQNTQTCAFIDLSQDYSDVDDDNTRNHMHQVLVDDSDVVLSQTSISQTQSKLQPKSSVKINVDYPCHFLNEGVWVASFEEIKVSLQEKDYGFIPLREDLIISEIYDFTYISENIVIESNNIKIWYNDSNFVEFTIEEFLQIKNFNLNMNISVNENDESIYDLSIYFNSENEKPVKIVELIPFSTQKPTGYDIKIKYDGLSKKLDDLEIFAVDSIKRNMLRELEMDDDAFSFELIEILLINWENYAVSNNKSILLQIGNQLDEEDTLETIDVYLPNETLIGTIEGKQKEDRVNFLSNFWPMKISPIQVDERKVIIYNDWMSNKQIPWEKCLPFLNPNNPNQHSLSEILYLSEEDLTVTKQTFKKARIKNTMSFQWNFLGKIGSNTMGKYGPSKYWKQILSQDFAGETLRCQTEYYTSNYKINVYDGDGNKQSMQGWEVGSNWLDGAMMGQVVLDETFGFVQIEVWNDTTQIWETQTYQQARVYKTQLGVGVKGINQNSITAHDIDGYYVRDWTFTPNYSRATVNPPNPPTKVFSLPAIKGFGLEYFTGGFGQNNFRWYSDILTFNTNQFPSSVWMSCYYQKLDGTLGAENLTHWGLFDKRNDISGIFTIKYGRNIEHKFDVVLEIGTNNKKDSLVAAIRKMVDWTMSYNSNFLNAQFDSGGNAQNGMGAVRTQFSSSNLKPEQVISNIRKDLINFLATQETTPISSIIYDSKWPIFLGCLNMLSEKILSEDTINKGQNDDARKYLPWTFDLFQIYGYTAEQSEAESKWTWKYAKFNLENNTSTNAPILDGSVNDVADLYCGLKSYYFKTDQQYPTPEPIWKDISNPISIYGDATGTIFTWPQIKDTIDEVSISTISGDISLGTEDYQKYMVYTTQDLTLLYGQNNAIYDRETWSNLLPIKQSYAKLTLNLAFPNIDTKIDRLIFRGIWGGKSFAFIKTNNNKVLPIKFQLFNDVDESISLTKLQL